uniref:P2Y purinoceptor 3-like n=3 Tax=Haplochromini TaxID=319058 RepID=A0A3Q2W0D4_HAPBU
MGLSQTSSITPDISLLAAVVASNHLNTSGTSHTSTLPLPSCSIDESYKYVFLPVCYSLTFLFSLTLNSVVLLRSCCHHGRRWNTSLIYMVNLATTDLMYGLSLPFLVASYVLRDCWVFGDFMCRLVRFLFYFNLYCSIFFLTCISVHRYLGICHPMRTITLESKRVVKGICALVWVVVFILTCPIFRFAQTGYVRRRYINCWDDAIDKEFADYVPYGIVLHLLGFFVPFVIIAWCYSHVVRTIFQTLLRGRERTSVSISGSQYSHYIRRRRKSIKTIVTITLLFALCFLPFHVTRTLFLLLRRGQLGGCNAMKTVSICYKVTRPLASCNAWLNALLYFLTGDKGGPSCWPAERTIHRDRRNGSLWNTSPKHPRHNQAIVFSLLNKC